jgi:hypothetical protein
MLQEQSVESGLLTYVPWWQSADEELRPHKDVRQNIGILKVARPEHLFSDVFAVKSSRGPGESTSVSLAKNGLVLSAFTLVRMTWYRFCGSLIDILEV